MAEREAAQNAKAQQRLMELVCISFAFNGRSLQQQIGSNSSLPVTVSSIRVIGLNHTRRSFLDRIFDPLISANRGAPYTLAEALQEVSTAADKLRRFGMLHSLSYMLV